MAVGRRTPRTSGKTEARGLSVIRLPLAYYGTARVPLLKRSHILAARRWPGVTISARGRQIYPVPPKRRNNPHLREEGDCDLPSTLTRSLPGGR